MQNSSSSSSRYQGGFMPGKFKDFTNLVTVIALPLALPAALIMRSRLGLRRLSLGQIAGATFLLYLVGLVATLHVSLLGGVQGGTDNTLSYVLILFPAWALWQNRKRWAELRRGDWWHTFSPGISRLEFLPLRLDRIYRNVDAAVAFLGGLVLKELGFAALGLCLMVSAMAFRIIEEHIYQAALKDDLDMGDALLEAHMRSRRAEQIGTQAEAKPYSPREWGGVVPTGADAALAAQIAKRKAEAAADARKHLEVYQ